MSFRLPCICNLKSISVLSGCLSLPDATSLHHCLLNHHCGGKYGICYGPAAYAPLFPLTSSTVIPLPPEIIRLANPILHFDNSQAKIVLSQRYNLAPAGPRPGLNTLGLASRKPKIQETIKCKTSVLQMKLQYRYSNE